MAEDGRAWQEIAAEDPEWVVLSLPQGKRGGWDPREFRATGERAVSHLLETARLHGGDIGTDLAVDVGCGVGRLTAALATRFERVVGIDITAAMLERARQLSDDGNVTFVAADITTDRVPEAEGADLVVSERVLQHLDPRDVAAHLRALMELLRPGGLAVVQVPTTLPWPVRLQPRRRLYLLLRWLGLGPRLLYWRLGLHPMRMRAVAPSTVETAVRDLAVVVGIEHQHEPTFGVDEAVLVLRRHRQGV
ncbi:MAG: class I SAM-dependent methyltransferase [Nitriliruptorales bacterium]|nr:class I SAM-dependent methyltransferase [Nitriliruptorales bacterium]